MFNYSVIRMIVILLYFTLCSACGNPADTDTPVEENGDDGTTTASDINYIGGGTQAPDPIEREREYQSPMMSRDPTPTRLNWVASVGQATRAAGEANSNYKIILWFTNDECVGCTTVERDVFTDPTVLANSRKWLFVKMDTERNEDRVQYYLGDADAPAFVFLDKRGNEYRKYFGIVNAEEFANMLLIWW